MDKMQFAELVAWVQHKCPAELKTNELDRLHQMVNRDDDQHTITPDCVRDMLKQMATGRKIEAIKTHRMITGDNLKESKDAIEAAMMRS
jgi:ribosomal protein L7/L12